MYIEPNSKFVLLKKCPLDNSYTHTIWFRDADAQYDYFYGLRKYVFTDQSYQRWKRGVMRVEVATENVYDCNYLMFQNTAYGNKWFYAFITGVEYVNNKTTEISYQIDVMQTWYFDYEMKHCFVEREHSRTDVIGENLVPENLETGEMVIKEDGHFDVFKNMSIVISATFDSTYNDKLGANYGGMFSGTIFHTFPNTADGIQSAINFIDGATGKSDGIMSMFLMPTEFIHNTDASILANAVQYDMAKPYDNIDGYTPRNKKLFTYPYNYLYLSNQQGNTGELRYEFFVSPPDDYTRNKYRLILQGDYSATPSIMLAPCFYKGSKSTGINGGGLNYDENLFLTNMPQLSFATDTYKAWYAQHENSMLLNATFGATSSIYSLFGANTSGSSDLGVMSDADVGLMQSNYVIRYGATFNSILKAIGANEGAKADVKNMPNKLHGQTSNNLLAAINKFGFYWAEKNITKQFAEKIDQFFDMYGYATHNVKVPNVRSKVNEFPRPQWCYTKTIGCELVGAMPVDDLNAIISIFDKGITFWKNGENVGNYSLDNSV